MSKRPGAIALGSGKSFISKRATATGFRRVARYLGCVDERTREVDGGHPGHAPERHAFCLRIPSGHHDTVSYEES